MSSSDRRFCVRVAVTVLAVILLLLTAKILFFWPKTTDVSTQAVPSPARRGGERREPAVISWQDAPEHYGEFCIVEGTIVLTYNSGKACFLNFHPDWRSHFTAVIFAKSFEKFPKNPQDCYRGKKVRVTGYIKEYKGKPEIILHSPEQIRLLE